MIQPYNDQLSAQEWQRLRKVIRDPRDRALFEVAYSHGRQACDVATLRPKDIRLRRKTIYLHGVQ